MGDGSSSAGLTPSSPYTSSARGVRESAESRAAVSTSPRTGCFELVSIHTHTPPPPTSCDPKCGSAVVTFFGERLTRCLRSCCLLLFFSPRAAAAAAAASQFLPYFFPSRSLRSAGRRSSYSPAPTSRPCFFAHRRLSLGVICVRIPPAGVLREASAFLFRVVRGAICRFRCRSNRLFERPCRFRCEGGAAPSGSFREPLDVAPASRTWPTARILCSIRRASRVGSPIAWGCRGPT